jgi:hypothetical protein
VAGESAATLRADAFDTKETDFGFCVQFFRCFLGLVTDVLKFTDCVARGKARAGNRQIAVASFLATWFSGSRGSWNPSETSNRGFGRSVASAPGPGWGQACSMTSAVVLAEATKTDVDSAPVSEVRRDPRNGADPGSPRRRRREHSRPPPHLPPRRPSRRARASRPDARIAAGRVRAGRPSRRAPRHTGRNETPSDTVSDRSPRPDPIHLPTKNKTRLPSLACATRGSRTSPPCRSALCV